MNKNVTKRDLTEVLTDMGKCIDPGRIASHDHEKCDCGGVCGDRCRCHPARTPVLASAVLWIGGGQHTFILPPKRTKPLP